MADSERLKLGQWATEQAIKVGAKQAAVTISNEKQIQTEYRDGQIESLKESTTNSLTLDLFVDDRYSSHQTSDVRRRALAELISQSVAATKFLAEDKSRSLPDPRYCPESTDKDLDILDSSYDHISSSKYKAIAAEIEQTANAQSDRIISTTAGCSGERYELIKVHSNGFSGRANGTIFSAGASVTVNDPDGRRPQQWYWASARFAKDLPDPQTIAKEAAARALSRIGQKKIASGKYDMLIENRAGYRLITMLNTAMSGRALQQKASYLEGMLGKKIASEKLSLTDNPWLKKGLASRLFDNEALAAKPRPMIRNGVLADYYLDLYYSRKLGAEPTSGSPSNAVFDCGPKSPAQLIAELRKAIFVTGFIGGNFNSTTGDFSFGIIGHLIDNGRIAAPVSEMNISGNGKDFWHRLAETANDPYEWSSCRTPAMLFESVVFSGA